MQESYLHLGLYLKRNDSTNSTGRRLQCIMLIFCTHLKSLVGGSKSETSYEVTTYMSHSYKNRVARPFLHQNSDKISRSLGPCSRLLWYIKKTKSLKPRIQNSKTELKVQKEFEDCKTNLSGSFSLSKQENNHSNNLTL